MDVALELKELADGRTLPALLPLCPPQAASAKATLTNEAIRTARGIKRYIK
jgi:hypothetical protein